MMTIFEEDFDSDFLGRQRRHHLHRHLFSLRLIATVLKPNLHLLFGEFESAGEVGSLGAGQVALVAEPTLELEDLRV